ncbi:uncharacterized protein [Prorops nasuta]|uniref:uncharacterized protein isoform X2 n=1 Tax=Prorops nasuta TaxID=863751 RepID=UPI0034CDB1F1
MDSNMSTAFMHRRANSSGASSTGTGSSIGGGPGNLVGSGAGRMAVIGVTRNVRLRRRGASGFGFSLRGGREYAAGFYVSEVQPGGEAHRNGLRVGDQIIRVNGYPVEDAVHQEVALLAKNQQVLVLKIRSVGMIPVKDNPNDPVTWHMVQQQQQQQQHGEYNEGGLGGASTTEIRLRILVGEKGRLGCGVCRGVVPGLTVQGTRENGPARAAGLKAGDVIIWCNGQRLTDLPFERAIEVMRGSAVLDVIVQRPSSNHLYDCPEPLWARGSSGYDSETSSIVSPPLRHNPSSPQHRYTKDDSCIRNPRICCPLALSTGSCGSSEWNHLDQSPEWTRKPNNTTVIRVNQNDNRGSTQPMHLSGEYEDDMNSGEPLYDPVAPRIDYEVHDFDANPREEANRRLAYRRQRDVIYDGSGDQTQNYKENGRPDPQRQVDVERKTITTVEVHQSVCPPAPPPPLPYKWPAEGKPMNAMGIQMGSTMSMGSTGSTETESSLESSCSKDSASTSSSLSTSSCEPPSNIPFGPDAANILKPDNRNVRTSPIATTNLSTAIAQELQRRAQQRIMKAEAGEKPPEPRKPQNAESLRSQEQKVAHDKLMEEFKLAHRKMFNNAQQRQQQLEKASEQEQEKRMVKDGAQSVTSQVPPVPPPLPVPKKRTPDESVEMQSIESFKLKEPPIPVVPKPPSTYFSGGTSNGTVRSPVKTQFNGKDEVDRSKPSSPLQEKPKNPGKVAIRIGAYVGESKQPAKLDFLGQQQQVKPEVKNPVANEESTNAPVVSRLQNELVATLQRSNLRRKTEADNQLAPKPVPDASYNSETTNPEPGKLPQSSVDRLASALGNRVTIKVNPENSAR